MLKELCSTKPDIVPKGWMTTKQWAKQETGDENKVGMTGLYLRKGVMQGVIEMKYFTIKSGTRILPVPHYRIKASRNNS